MQSIDVQTPLKTAAEAWLWIAAANVPEVKFKVVQRPKVREDGNEVFVMTDHINKTVNTWCGVTFACPVIKLHISQTDLSGTTIALIDNRQNDLEVQEFTPDQPINMKGSQLSITLTWQIDTNKFRFDLTSDQCLKLLRPVYSYRTTSLIH
jgi:hypothetical protein